MNIPNKAVKENIVIPNEIKLVRKVSSRILKKLEPFKVDESTLFDIRLCVEETVRNAVEHGSPQGEESDIKISYTVKGGKFVFVVEDEGSGFDPMKVPDPTKKENIMKTGGRGVYLVRRLMDKVEFNKKGNRITLIKKL